jgi:beta-lactam-binding protein with PASTA domain
VDLVVSLGQPEVPDVIGMTEPNAIIAITAVDNLTVGSITDQYSDTVARDAVISQSPAPNTPVLIGSSVDLVVSLGQPEVPDVIGMTEPNAIIAITAVDNLTVGSITDQYSDTVARDVVISQSPAPNTPVLIGSSVDLVVSLGRPVTVPDVLNRTEAEANSVITSAGLTVGTITHEYSETVTAGLVISQNPVGGTTVPADSSVDLVISLGQSVVVPNVVGQPEADANSAITSIGLISIINYVYSDTVSKGLVVNQNPVGETTVPMGSSVELAVSLGRPVVPDVVGESHSAAVATIEGIDNLRVAASYRHHNTVPKDDVISQNPAGGAEVAVGSTVNIVVSLGRPVVPGVVGMEEAKAIAAIVAVDGLAASVTYEYNNTIPAGTVISQSPDGGTVVDVGTTVNIVVSSGRPEVPDVVGMTLAEATTTIEGIDNLMVSPAYRYDNNVPFGDVISQYPPAGTIVDTGTTINIVVSLGQPVVPGVIDMTEADANSYISSVDNLTVGTVTEQYSDTVEAGDVMSQNPVGGTAVPIGSTVDLVLSLGRPEVPHVIESTEADANLAISAVDNLQVGTVTYKHSDTVDEGLVMSQNPVGGTAVPIGSSVDLVVSLGEPNVPDVVGMTEAEANSAITAESLVVGAITYEESNSVPAGLVISQNPVAGTVVLVGSAVDLIISGFQAPDVVGMTETEANSTITAWGLVVGDTTYEDSNTIPAGLVISQNPVGGTMVSIGSQINLAVSGVTVPFVVGMAQADANSTITAAGNLAVGVISYEYSDTMDKGFVISQSPAGWTVTRLNSSVDLVVSLGQPSVPNTIDMNEADANSAITAVDNLTLGTVTYEYSDMIAKGLVISQSPVAGTTVPVGSSVDLVISRGRPEVPYVVGLPQAEAAEAIEGVDSLSVGTVTEQFSDTVARGIVISQSPSGGTEVPIGTSVDLVVSLGPPIVVPNVVDKPQAIANSTILSAGLAVGTITPEYHNTTPIGSIISQDPVGGTIVPLGTAVNLVTSLGRPIVPDVVSMQVADANSLITSFSLVVGSVTYVHSDTVDYGIVMSQSPVGGTEVLVGTPVDLVVSLGQPEVPYVVGMPEADANAAIIGVDNLTIGAVTYEYSDTVAKDYVISQDPVGGTVVPTGSTVDLVVSLGQPEVPYVVGIPEADANAAIIAVDNLTVGEVTYEYNDTVEKGIVINQNPPAGTKVPIGSLVDLVVSLSKPTVPDLIGMTEPEANSALTAVSLVAGTVTYVRDDSVPPGTVVSQDPAAGTVVSVGSPVDLVVSLCVVPDVVGMPKVSANSALAGVRLVIGRLSR